MARSAGAPPLPVAASGVGVSALLSAPWRSLTGAAALGLLLVGIHNTWDTVTHVVLTGSHGDATKKE